MAIYNNADTVSQMIDVANNGTETTLPNNPFKDYVVNASAYIRDGFQTIATTIDNVRHNILFDGIPPIEEQPNLARSGIRLFKNCANLLGLNVDVNEAEELIINFITSIANQNIATPFGMIDLATKGGYILADYLSKGMNAIIENIQLGGPGGYVIADGNFTVDGTNYIAGDWSQFCDFMDSRWDSIKDYMQMHQSQPFSDRSYENYWEYVLNANSFTEYWGNMKVLHPNSNYTSVENATNTVFGYQVVSADLNSNYSDTPYGRFIILAIPLSTVSSYTQSDNSSHNLRVIQTSRCYIDAYQMAFGFFKAYNWDGWAYRDTDSEKSFIAAIGGYGDIRVSKQLDPTLGPMQYPTLGTYQGPASCYGKGEFFVYTDVTPGGEMTDGLSYQNGEDQGSVQDTIDAITGDDGFDTDKFLQYLEDNGYNHLSKMLTDEEGNQHLMLPTNLSEIFGLVNDIRELNKNKADLLDNVQNNDDNFAYGQEGVVGKLADDGITSPINMVTVGVNERVYTKGRELYLRQIVPILREGLTPDNSIFKFEYDGSIKNLKVFAGELNSYIIISKCTGNQMRFNPEDIIKLDNFIPHNQKPEFNITADLRVQGSPKMFPRYYHNTANNLMMGLITGHTWLNAVNVFYGRYGSELANNNYQMGSKTLLVNSNFEQLGNMVKLAPAALAGAGIAGGLASNGLSTAVGYSYDPASFTKSAASMAILQGSLNTIGNNSLNAGMNLSKSTVNDGTLNTSGGVLKNEYNYRQQKAQLDYANMMATNPTVAPAIEFPYEESNVDLYGNYFTIARYYLSETQRKFMDDFYTLWGYKTGGVDITTDEMDWLHSRSHFNYLSMSDVSLAKKEISVFERQEMEAELGNIRLWHDMLPRDWSQSDGNNIVEVEQ